MTDLELELRALAAHLDVPPTPALVARVGARLARRRQRRRLLVVALAAVVAALAVALAVPSSRAALLRFFHIQGAVVTIVDRLPPLTPQRSLGVPIRPSDASFRLLLPVGRRPEGVYESDSGYWLRYRGLLLFEFESGAGPEILKKAALGTTVEYVRVGGAPGIWINGRHALYLPGGPPLAAGRTLIWRHGSLTLRLEANVTRERAIGVAATVR